MAADKAPHEARRRGSAGALPYVPEPARWRLAAVSDGLNQAVTVTCVFCILVMLGISFVGAFYMSITGDALSWTYSLARLFIPWLALLSITIAYKAGEHIAMTSVLHVLPRRILPLLRAVNIAVTGLFAVLLVWYGWSYAMGSQQLYMVSDRIQIDARWVAAAVPVTGMILVIHMLCGSLMTDPSISSQVPEPGELPGEQA
jgi:TRAP-type C4-dicarboxylate transport system permease small subunit